MMHYECGCCPFFKDLLNELMTVGIRSGNSHEQIAGLNGARIDRDSGRLRIRQRLIQPMTCPAESRDLTQLHVPVYTSHEKAGHTR